MRVVFRVDASMQLGSGHLMRCLTLAEALQERGVETRFICGDQDGNLNDWLQGKGVAVTVLPQALLVDAIADVEQTILALGADRPAWMVVDQYGLDIEWEWRLKPLVGRLMVIDDHTGRVHDCDLLLDQNYSVEGSQHYVGLVPAACKMLIGPNYALLRKEFSELREQIKRRQSLEKILVFFTAGDDKGETMKAMLGLEMFGRAKQVDVVVGRSNPHIIAIKNKCEEMHWGYHCQVDYMPTLISNADLVVGAGGVSIWERCALGVPALVTILADNQALIALALDSAGVLRNLGWLHTLKPIDYANALRALDARQIANMSEKAMSVVDAAGAMRVVDAMLFNY